ncbi:MAG: class I SAM-dependent methyltransferase [Candidatus ainarchaeum sp.]|nr:class I SAM-dependent methyltransferase [Candidatus ainarchaeum sp.]
MDEKWLEKFFQNKDLHPNRTGQSAIFAGPPNFGGRYNYDELEDIKTKNLGLGWIYYSLARLYKPKLSVAIGSGRGFCPILLAKGIKDNENKGILEFIDPSLDDDFWKNLEKNKEYFSNFEINDVINHTLLTTQEFVKTDKYKNMNKIDLMSIDASHFYEFVKDDWEHFKNKISDNGIIIFHDSISRSANPKWSGPRKVLLEIAKDPNYQFFDLKFGAGLTLVQKNFFEQSKEYIEKLDKEWTNPDKDLF